MESSAIGMVETSSIASGILAQDAMLKAAEVSLIVARSICSGKYIVIIGGNVGAVKASVEAGIMAIDQLLIEELVIPNVHSSVFQALAQAVTLEPGQAEALGIIETFSAASIIEAADAAVKAADVILFRVHVAMAVGGKGFLLLTGDVAAVQAAVAAGAARASERGMLVNKIVIPRPRPEVFQDYI